MSNDQQIAVSKLFNFFCGLHLLVNSAETLNQTLRAFESVQSDGKSLGSIAAGVGFSKNSEPGIFRLVSCARHSVDRQMNKQGFTLSSSFLLKISKLSTLPLPLQRQSIQNFVL